MPFTPFHFGPSACVAIPLYRSIDMPVFILANVVVDIEPLLVLTLGLDHPLHGYAHTFLGAAAIGMVWSMTAYSIRSRIADLMTGLLRFPYSSSRSKMLISGIFGAWLHVILDIPLYHDIRPFWPFPQNPLLGMIDQSTMYMICLWSFIPAAVLFIAVVRRSGRTGASQ